MSLAAGRLRHRIQIEEQISTINSSGESEKEWQHVAEVWAAIEPVSGRELLQAQQVQSKVTTRITIRSRSGVRASMRAIHKTSVYNIEAVITDPESGIEWMTLQCSTGVNQG